MRKMRFEGSAHIHSRLPYARVVFNVTGLRAACGWRLAGERRGHVARSEALYVLPAGADCVVDMDEGVDIRCLTVPNEAWGLAVGEHSCPSSRLRDVVGGDDPVLLTAGRAMEREAGRGFPNGILYWTSLADAVIERLISEYLPGSPPPVGGTLSSRALGRINGFIEASLDEPITLDDLAQVAAQSRFHFQRTFRRSLGLTPHRYVMLVRLKRAVSLIRAGDGRLAAIAADTGFVDQSHLSRWVKEVYGITPSAMRGQ